MKEDRTRHHDPSANPERYLTTRVCIEGEIRQVYITKGAEVLHPEGFSMEVDEVYENEMVEGSDSDGSYIVHKDEVGIPPDLFLDGHEVDMKNIYLATIPIDDEMSIRHAREIYHRFLETIKKSLMIEKVLVMLDRSENARPTFSMISEETFESLPIEQRELLNTALADFDTFLQSQLKKTKV